MIIRNIAGICTSTKEWRRYINQIEHRRQLRKSIASTIFLLNKHRSIQMSIKIAYYNYCSNLRNHVTVLCVDGSMLYCDLSWAKYTCNNTYVYLSHAVWTCIPITRSLSIERGEREWWSNFFPNIATPPFPPLYQLLPKRNLYTQSDREIHNII